MTIVDDPTEALRLAEDRPDDLLALHLEEVPAGALSRLSTTFAQRVLLVGQRPPAAGILDTLPPEIGAILVKQEPVLSEDLLVVANKLRRRDIFGLDKYLAWGSVVHRMTLADSSRRGEDAIDALDRVFTDLGVDARLVGQILTIADEFITNAFYNAPTDAAGRRLYAHRSRIDPIESERGVEISYASDGRWIGVGVLDHHGSFEPAPLRKLLGHLGSPQGEVSFNTSGAGLGLATASRIASMLVFNVAAGRASECIGLIDVTGGYRQFAERGKFCQVFHQPRVP